MKNNIVDNIKTAKYFGIIFDNTPDISHADQMSYVIRYVHIEVDQVKVKESFLGFFCIAEKIAVKIKISLRSMRLITWIYFYVALKDKIMLHP